MSLMNLDWKIVENEVLDRKIWKSLTEYSDSKEITTIESDVLRGEKFV